MGVVVFWVVAAVLVVGLLVGSFAYDRVRRNSRMADRDGAPGNAHSTDVVVQQEHLRNAGQTRNW
jgi:hypothetical protein